VSEGGDRARLVGEDVLQLRRSLTGAVLVTGDAGDPKNVLLCTQNIPPSL
jgi:hypothetical protein